MPMYQARQPGVTILGVRHHAYRAVSREVEQVFSTLGHVTMRSIDEGNIVFEDETLDPSTLVEDIETCRRHVLERYGLSVSVGIGESGTVAKVASGRAKPGGLLSIAAGSGAEFLRSVHLEELPGLGPRSLERLQTAGITSTTLLSGLDEHQLRALVGPSQTESLRRILAGGDPLEARTTARQISASRTYEYDLVDEDAVRNAALLVLAEAWQRTRDRAVRSITLRMTTTEGVASRSRRFPLPTDEPRNLTTYVLRLLDDLRTSTHAGAVRLLSVSLEISEGGGQHELFETAGPDMPIIVDRELSLGDVVFKGMSVRHTNFGAGHVSSAGREGLLVAFADGERLLDPWLLPREAWDTAPDRAAAVDPGLVSYAPQSRMAASRASAKEPNPPSPSA